MVPNPSTRSGAAVNQAPAGGSCPSPVRCSTTGIPAVSSSECAAGSPSAMSSMLTASMPTRAAPLPGQPGRPGPGEEVRALGVARRAEPGVVAGVQQHRLPADLERRQRADVDAALPRARHPDHHGRQVSGPVQRDRAQVGAAGVAVVGRVQVGPGVADQADPADGELGARGVAAARGFPGQVRGDLRPGSPG